MLESIPAAYLSRKSLSHQRLNGVYYTPRPLSQILVDWAIQDSSDDVLEPSFGGCVFLESSFRRLKQIGAVNPAAQIFGSDQDLAAHRFLDQIDGFRRKNFVHGDFIGLTPDAFEGKRFDAVVGNPPYVSLHNMSLAQREALEKLVLTKPLAIDHKASLWAFFVAHSVSFLKKDSRMAFVLPASLLHSFYGRQLLVGLEQVFHRCVVISIAEQCFRSEGAKEKVMLLFAEGAFRGPSAQRTQLWGVADAVDVRSALSKWDEQKLGSRAINGHAVPQLLSDRHTKLSHDLSEGDDTIAIKDIATIKIGLVTGANRFFILTYEDAMRFELPRRLLRPVMSKFAICRGLFLTQDDFDCAKTQGNRFLLFSCSEKEDDAATLRYLATFPLEERRANKTFEKRPYWHRPDEGKIPDAFLTYMVKDGPRMAFNSLVPVNSTNTVHRVYFKPDQSNTLCLLRAICLLSSHAQLSAEFECRTYGSGVLKVEPSEASKIRIPKLLNVNPNTIMKLARTVDGLLRAGKRQDAVDTVDTMVSDKLPQFVRRLPLNKIRTALEEARTRRYVTLKGKPVQEI